jgi:hypothetical protein
MILWVSFLLFIIYSFAKSCFRRNNDRANGPTPSYRPGGSGWFPGGSHRDTSPPPAYSKNLSNVAGRSWTPGFWTGAALGGLGTYLMSDRRRTEPRVPWDWERPRASVVSGRPRSSSDDRGEGPSNLGAMRRSTGFGGSSVR